MLLVYMQSLTTLCIFIIILFLYIHIASQYKKSGDLEIYETDFTNTQHLEDVCELKQPVLMDVQNLLPSLFQTIIPEEIAQYSRYDVHVKDVRDYQQKGTIDPIVLPLHTTVEFFESDQNSNLYSENNEEFLEETQLLKKIKQVDSVLQPNFLARAEYDLLFGSCHTSTPFRYQTESRNFFIVTHGKIRVKMTNWENSKYMEPVKDYDNYEFRSLQQSEKVRFIEFDVHEGSMLYVPPYWWYSLSLEEPNTFVCKCTYASFINQLSNIWDIGLYYLQQQNISKTVRREIPLSQDSVDKHNDEKSHDKDNDEVIELNESESSPPVKENIEFDLNVEEDTFDSSTV